MKKWISLLPAVALCVIIPGCTDQTPPSTLFNDTTSLSNSSNDTLQMHSSPSIPGFDSESISLPSDTSGSSENEKIEALIHEYHGKGSGYPRVADDKYEGMYVCFEKDKKIHIPIPSDGPGFTRAYDISYLKGHDFLVIAYNVGKPNSISFLRTEDKGVSWQSSELDAEYPWGFYSLAFLNSHDGIFLLQDRDVDTNQSRGDNIIYTTESYGETWKQAGYLSGDYSIINGIKVAEDHYWITGQKDTDGEAYDPVLLKSDDGLNWREVQISIDTTKYIKGYCTDVYFSGEMGLATVIGITANNEIVHMWFSSEDRGETWSYYKICP